MLIRREKQSDHDEVRRLVKISFATNEGDDGTTHDYLDTLRRKDVFIPELSLVTENEGGVIIGQVLLYKADISTPQGMITELLLSPICVHPNYFRKGIARAMIEEVLSLAKDMGFRAVFLCGTPEIYGKLGFTPTFRYNIFHKTDESKEARWSMVRELYGGALGGVSGIIDTV
jgi:predicted N-acetyltransferase YhbS